MSEKPEQVEGEQPFPGVMIDPERMQLIFSMAKKKANAALGHVREGTHFRVYGPQVYLDNPGIIRESEAYSKLKDTVWWVRWYDDECNQLSFLEFLNFIAMIDRTYEAFRKAQQQVAVPKARRSKHAGGWQPKKNRDRPTKKLVVKTQNTINVTDVLRSGRIQDIFDRTAIELEPRPDYLIN